jgi:hypothetical protein
MEMVEKMDEKWGWKRERNSEMYPDSKRFGDGPWYIPKVCLL